MAIDPRIALGVQPVQIQSPLASFGQALQLKDLIGQQDMRALQMREYERKQQEEMTLRDLMRGKSGPELETALTQAGYGERALGIRKERLAGDKSAAETQKAQLESAMNGYQFAANMAAGVNSQQAYDAMKAQFAQNPLFAPVVQNMPAQWSPEVSEELKRGALAAAGKIEAILPRVTDRDVGGTIQTVSTDPVSGRQTVAGVTPKTMTPGDVQQSRDAAAGRAVTMRGQDLTRMTAQERLQWEQQNPRLVPFESTGGVGGYDPRRNTFYPANVAGGQPPAAQPAQSAQDRPADFGKPAFGKPKAQLDAEVNTIEREKANANAASVAADSLGVLDKAITHPGRTISTGGTSVLPIDRIPGTDAADFRAVRKQLEGKAFLQAFETLKGGGQITEIEGRKATEAIARLDTAQSDEEYLTALRELRGIVARGYERASGKPAPKEPTMKIEVNGSTPPKINSDAEFDALPSGAEFIAPDGTRRRKP